jgi:hypothetical protein
MTRSTLLLATTALFWLGGDLSAGGLCAGGHRREASVGAQLRCTRCAVLPCCCPDDYCRKPLPCIPCLRLCCVPDDYCPKPLPCVPCLSLGCCPDDYCPKPLPSVCWPVVNRQLYRCPPGMDKPGTDRRLVVPPSMCCGSTDGNSPPWARSQTGRRAEPVAR